MKREKKKRTGQQTRGKGEERRLPLPSVAMTTSRRIQGQMGRDGGPIGGREGEWVVTGDVKAKKKAGEEKQLKERGVKGKGKEVKRNGEGEGGMGEER